MVRGTIKNAPMVLTPQVQTAALTLQADTPASNKYTISMDDDIAITVKFEDLMK